MKLIINLFFLLFVMSCTSQGQTVAAQQAEFSGTITYKYEYELKGKKCNYLKEENIDSMRLEYDKGNLQILQFLNGKIIGYTKYNPTENKIYRLNKTKDTLYCENENTEEKLALADFKLTKCDEKIEGLPCKCMQVKNGPKVNTTLYYSSGLYINRNSFKSNRISNSYYFDQTHALFLKYILDVEGCKEIYIAIRIEKKELDISNFELFKLPILQTDNSKN